MNNKFMYNRCIIPEIGVQHEWLTEETQESRKLKKIQKGFVKKRSREEKLKLQSKYITCGSQKMTPKKKRKKAECRKNEIFFRRIEGENKERRRYEKVNRGRRVRKITQKEMQHALTQSGLIYGSFLKTHPEVENEEKGRRGTKEKERKHQEDKVHAQK